MKRSILLFFGGLTFLAVGLAGCFSSAPDNALPLDEHLKRFLTVGKFAPLPPTAREIKLHHIPGFLYHERFCHFIASASDIIAFVASSPAMISAPTERFDDKHQFLPIPENLEKISEQHEYFPVRTAVCPWYDPTITVKGRRYEIDPAKAALRGEVIVNDASESVFIWITVD
jgi:hypothetical protein